MDSTIYLIMNITYTIARYEQIQLNEFLVAFNIKDDNDNSAYVESRISSSEISSKTTQEICQLAYNNILDKIESIKADFEKNNVSKIGYQFVPENNE